MKHDELGPDEKRMRRWAWIGFILFVALIVLGIIWEESH